MKYDLNKSFTIWSYCINIVVYYINNLHPLSKNAIFVGIYIFVRNWFSSAEGLLELSEISMNSLISNLGLNKQKITSNLRRVIYKTLFQPSQKGEGVHFHPKIYNFWIVYLMKKLKISFIYVSSIHVEVYFFVNRGLNGVTCEGAMKPPIYILFYKF